MNQPSFFVGPIAAHQPGLGDITAGVGLVAAAGIYVTLHKVAGTFGRGSDITTAGNTVATVEHTKTPPVD